MSKIKQEPIITWFTAHVAVNAGQISISGLPTWVHIVILVLSTLASATGARSQVSPTNA